MFLKNVQLFGFIFYFNPIKCSDGKISGSEPRTADLPFIVTLHNIDDTLHLNRYNSNGVLNLQIGEKSDSNILRTRVKCFCSTLYLLHMTTIFKQVFTLPLTKRRISRLTHSPWGEGRTALGGGGETQGWGGGGLIILR